MEKDCLFCRIATGETSTEIVYENDLLVVFHDINPHAPVHLLIVPKTHVRSINDIRKDDLPVIAEMHMVAKEMAARYDVAASGYKLLFNVERGGGQLIFHLHMHLMGGWKR